MNDYIDREGLVGWLTRPSGFRANCEDCVEIDCLDCILEDAIKVAPAVDAQEIKHGEWVKDDSDGCYCSVCEWYADYDYDYVTNNGLGNDDFNYCSHCGAKMDGGNNNVTC